MVFLRWPRHYRGIVAPLLLLLAAGWLPHHDADHGGEVRHVDEAHGSHGTLVAKDVERLPGVGALPVPASLILHAELPDLKGQLIRVVPQVESALWPAGHDPPGALGSRAPPLLSL